MDTQVRLIDVDKIKEELQKMIASSENDYFIDGLEEALYIIDHAPMGAVLPKKHGDLIDRDELKPDCYDLEIHDGDDWRNEYCGVSVTQIDDAKVIIKATS